MGFQKIIGLGTPEYPQDATTKEYTDAADQNLQTQINNRATFSYVDGKKLNDFSANGDINIGTNHIYEGSVGSFNTQLATQSYVLTSDNNVRLYAGTVAGNAETSAIASAKSYTDSVGSGLEW